MALFNKILSFFRKADNTAQPHPTCEEHRAVLAFEKDLDFFMHEDDFKSRKEYQYLCDNDLSSIKTEGFRYEVINNYLKSSILQYPELVDKLILFFGSYFDAPYEGDDLNAFFNYLKKFRILTSPCPLINISAYFSAHFQLKPAKPIQTPQHQFQTSYLCTRFEI